VPHRDDVKLEDYVLSADHVTLFERVDGAQRARVVPTPAGAGLLGPAPLPPGAPIDFDAAVYELGAGAQGDFASPVVRLSFSSLATPPTVVDVHAATRARCVKRVAPVLGGFDAAKYETRRLWATSHDGTRVPVSLVYRADLVAPGTPAPCLLNGYGSYEACNDPGFRQTKLPLLDRGVVFAIAHVRGGGEMGRKWYEDGKFDKKPSTWLDFVAVARHLVAEGVTDPSVLAIEGRSAGGLLIGAALNEAPDLFCAAVSGVGFVDVLTTMLDETIPLTVIERDEWGDPLNSADAYTSIAAYSPIDNVVPGAAYPTVMATCGLHDPRVGYWEPAKWVARLRAVGAPRGPILLKTELGAGHFSKSGRLERLLPVAEEHAFVLKSMGLLHAPKR
jgi:oligopeptidase B